MRDEYTVGQAAEELKVHRLTILNWERKGLLKSTRNYNNHRIFEKEDILKLKEMLGIRKPANN